MRYRVIRSRLARRDIRDMALYLAQDAGVSVARRYLEDLNHDLTHLLATRPLSFTWFHETGAPYRAKLFRLAQTTYWIVYTVDADQQCVEIVRFWSTAREPGIHGL